MKKCSIPAAAAIYSFNPTRKRTLLGKVATKAGWKYAEVVERDEKERKERAAKWFENKQLRQKAFVEAKEKILADEKYKAKVEILKKFGYA